MNPMPASIFNDVIGPVMRGPSSSHVAAAARIGQLIHMSAQGGVTQAIVDFDPNGSLAESYHGHGSDIGLVSGLMGMELTDPQMTHALDIAKQKQLDVQFRILSYGAIHPNNYRMHITDSAGNTHLWEAISVGGGMIEVQKLDEFSISICGDFHDLLLLVERAYFAEIHALIQKYLPHTEQIDTVNDQTHVLINIKTTQAVDPIVVDMLRTHTSVQWVMTLQPVLPTQSRANCTVPFRCAQELLQYVQEHPGDMWQMATRYESARGGTTEEDVYQKMKYLATLMLQCVDTGLKGTEFADRILGPQAYLMNHAAGKSPQFPSPLLSNIIRNITSIMEVKSSMGIIIAAPTAGSCGCLPGTVTGAAQTLGLDIDHITKGLLAAGLTGVFIAEQATFAAEVAGCQAECGAGSCMAAAALVQMMGGTVQQCVDAASFAMQNITGLACDPVANRVEVPCLGKNIMGGSNALSAAAVILAGYQNIIPLDETIRAMYDIGIKLPGELRCTLGGLGKTPASFALRQRLEQAT